MRVTKSMIYLLAVVIFGLNATIASAQAWNNDPASLIGPNYWGKITFPFATCGGIENNVFVQVGKKQTPINIITANAINASLESINFDYEPTPFKIENTGHVVEVHYNHGSYFKAGNEEYELLQFHLHAPSEHKINGQLAAAELHLVHINALSDLAVVGVMVEVAGPGVPVNQVVNDVLINASVISGQTVNLMRSLHAKDVLPKDSGKHYRYSGSLTTPPCSEGVSWFVLREPIYVSQAAINHMHMVVSSFTNSFGYPNNNRPVMPLNGRKVFQKL